MVSSRRAWLWRAGIVAVLLAAFAARAWQLGAQSLWFDEGWSWYLARLPLSEMLATTAGDRSPALYYGLLGIWIRFTGDSEFALRAFSLFADTTATAAVIALAARLGGGGRRFGALVGGLLYATCAFAAWYAGEARMYALVAALCAWSTYFLLRWSARPSGRLAFLSAGLLAAAIHSHYYAVFLMPAHALLVFTRGIRLGTGGAREAFRVARGWLAPILVCLATVVIWLVYARGGFAYDDGFAFPLNTVDGRLAEVGRMIAGGTIGQASRALPDAWDFGLIVLFMGPALALALKRRWRALFTLAALIGVPLLTAATVVRVVYPFRSVFHPRYLIFVVPFVAALIGVAICLDGGRSARARAAGVAALGGVAAALALWLPALWATRTDSGVARDDTRSATRHVIEALAPGQTVVMIRDNYAARYYWEHLGGPPAVLLAAPEGLHGVLADERAILSRLDALGTNAVRLFLWQDDVVDAQKRIETNLQANGDQLGEISFGQIRLPLYRLNQRPLQPIDTLMRPVGAYFGPNLELVEAWMRADAFPGDLFHAALVWRPVAPLEADYKVFAQVLDGTGKVVFQRDKLPLNTRQPMTRWAPGVTLRDPYTLDVPADLVPGDYRVTTGVYDAVSGERLPAVVAGAEAPGGVVTLGTLRVRAR